MIFEDFVKTSDDFVLVMFNGLSYPTMAMSPTGQLLERYKRHDYGSRSTGERLYVLKEDAEKWPTVYMPFEVTPLPLTADDDSEGSGLGSEGDDGKEGVNTPPEENADPDAIVESAILNDLGVVDDPASVESLKQMDYKELRKVASRNGISPVQKADKLIEEISKKLNLI